MKSRVVAALFAAMLVTPAIAMPDSPQGATDSANQAFKRELYEVALMLYRKALRANPNYGPAIQGEKACLQKIKGGGKHKHDSSGTKIASASVQKKPPKKKLPKVVAVEQTEQPKAEPVQPQAEPEIPETNQKGTDSSDTTPAGSSETTPSIPSNVGATTSGTDSSATQSSQTDETKSNTGTNETAPKSTTESSTTESSTTESNDPSIRKSETNKSHHMPPIWLIGVAIFLFLLLVVLLIVLLSPGND